MRRHLSVFLVLATLILVGSVWADTNSLTPPPEPAMNPLHFLATSKHLNAKPRSQLLVPATMSEDFEGTWPSDGWELSDRSEMDGGEYLWGKRDCHPHSGSYAGLCVGGGAQGNALACEADYPSNAETWAVYGPFSLAGVSSATLTFYLYGESEWDADCVYDYLYVGGSSDGENFQGGELCGDGTEGPDGQGYTRFPFDLDTWLGQGQVWVAFLFVSDGSLEYNGFTIDDVSINVSTGPTTPTTTDTPGPTATSTETSAPGPTPTSTETPGPVSTRPLRLPLVMKARSKESTVERVTSTGGGIVTTENGYQLNVPPEGVPFRQDGSDYEVAFSIETGLVPPAPVPSWAQQTDAIVKFGPDGFDFAYPIAMQLPIPPLADLAQLSLLRYHADQDKWLRMPMTFSGDSITSVSGAGYDLGYTALVVRPPEPEVQMASASAGLTDEMWWYDGALRISNSSPHDNGLSPLTSRPVNIYLLLKSFTAKYPMQQNTGYVPDWTVLRTGSSPDSSPARETVWFMYQGTYEWCVSATEWYPPPMGGAKKFMYADTITIVIDEPSHNRCQVSPCWTNLVEFPDLDSEKWSETTPCSYNPGHTAPVGTGDFQSTLSWVNTEGAATDLDLHLYGPNGIHVFYDAKTSPDGSLQLDRDWRSGLGNAIENIYSLATMPAGQYTLRVRLFRGTTPKSFSVRTIHGAVVKTYNLSLSQVKEWVTIETFTR